ncbi:hypothetical protein ACFOTA_19790 [Chitinophaga sp. GCM10012297]|uniref:Uncharacterized protein n=1 Tax=Chitinophaga chungangae TaxID=2821488 RepID=A0ABS3YJ52_9BACT|nr:hypothetical protein [Chitinophaga chungangae]MBO9154465.1 hypothetical protein [Chitinophaga chungangae]
MIKFLLSTLVIVPGLLLLKTSSSYGYAPIADTLQPVKTAASKPVEKPVATLQGHLPKIKEVPKSRRMIKPMAVPSPLPIKPVRIIKPKIIPGKIL